MRTDRSLTACREGGLPVGGGGVGGVQGVSLPGGLPIGGSPCWGGSPRLGGLLARGGSTCWGGLLAGWGLTAGGVSLLGGLLAWGSPCQGGSPCQRPPLWTESTTPVKTLPWPNFVAAGNEVDKTSKILLIWGFQTSTTITLQILLQLT